MEPLPHGVHGNTRTLYEMAKIVREDAREPDLRRFVLDKILSGVRGHDYRGEIDACFRFARDRITYRRDPRGVERVADMWSTLYALADEPEGDCGIKSTFLATTLALLGHKPLFIVLRTSPRVEYFQHVYVGVGMGGAGVVLELDPTPEDKPSGWGPQGYRKMACDIF